MSDSKQPPTKVEPQWGYDSVGNWVILNAAEYEPYRTHMATVRGIEEKRRKRSSSVWLYGNRPGPNPVHGKHRIR